MSKFKTFLAIFIPIALLTCFILWASGVFTRCHYSITTFSITKWEDLGECLTENNQTNLNISIDEDLTGFAKTGSLRLSAFHKKLTGCTIDGNGHTLTIKGDEGLLSNEDGKLFGTLENCTVKDLTIVYDMSLKSKSNSGFGGLAYELIGCNISNVNVVYNRKLSYYGSGKNIVAGFAAIVDNSTIKNCHVKGDIYGSGAVLSGFAGTVRSKSVIDNCSFTGSIQHNINNEVYWNECYSGYVAGLVDTLYGEIKNSYVSIDNFDVMLNTSGEWRAVDGFVGLLCGYVGGSVKNCYVDINDGCEIALNRNTGSVFPRAMYAGLLSGHVRKGGKIKNVYLDATKWKDSGETVSKCKVKPSISFGRNESTNIENVYFVDDYDYFLDLQYDLPYTELSNATGQFRFEKNGDPDKAINVTGTHYRLKFEFEMLDNPCMTVVDFYLGTTKDDNTTKWYYDSSVMKLDEHTWNVFPVDTVMSQSVGNTSVHGYNDDIDAPSHWWDVSINLDLQAKKGIVSVKRTHLSFTDGAYISKVHDYKDIVFDNNEGVIGGSEADNPWTTNEEGKLVFKKV